MQRHQPTRRQLLLGYILVRRCHIQLRATVHTVSPAYRHHRQQLRLLASCLLYLRIGWSALPVYHTWFGYAMVVVTVLILWGVGFVLPEETPAPPHNAPANQPPESQSQDHTDIKRRDP